MNKAKGYTLIEVMIALLVFSILATMTTGVLRRVLDQYRHIQDHYRIMQQTNKVITTLQYQTQFYVKHTMKTADNRQFPAFIGQHDYCEWTYTSPPDTQLNRVAYVCSGNQLIQRVWPSKPGERNQFLEKKLLSGLTQCHFRYANIENKVTGHWSSDKDENPHGLQIMLAWGPKQTLDFWFSLPPFNYELLKKL